MIGLNKLGTAIAVVIALTLAALFLEIFYVLWRRHRFRRRSHSDLGTPHKHFLRFLCCKHKSRVEPQETSLPASSTSPPELSEQVMKWQCLYGPSRVLFTIKEEEREGFDSENCSSAETVVKTKRACYSTTAPSTAVATECGGRDGNVEEVAITIDLSETTPFSTPCASPPYFTPSSSPSRELGNGKGCLMIQTAPEKDEAVTVFPERRQHSMKEDIKADQIIS